MRNLFMIMRVVLAAILLALLFTSVSAESIIDELPLSSMSMEGMEKTFKKILSVPKGELIVAFDVSEEDGIVFVTTTHMTSEYHLWHMDQTGNTIAVYSFECSGAVGIAWDGADICVFFSRGSVVEKIDRDGTLKERLSLMYEDYKTDRVWQSLAYRKEKEVSTGTYMLRANGLGVSPLKSMYDATELVFVERETGKEIILYDVSEAASAKSWFLFVLLIVFLVSIIIGIKRSQRSKGDSSLSETHDNFGTDLTDRMPR